MINQRQSAALRSTRKNDAPSRQEREHLLKPFLPETPSGQSSISNSPQPSRAPSRRPSRRPPLTKTRTRRKPIRTALKHGLYVFLYTAIHFFFSIWIRSRMAYRSVKYRAFSVGLYHHRTPELIRQDIKNIKDTKKLPEHLSIILHLNREEDKRTSVLRLINEVGELTAWCASAGIPVVSIYEKTGVLKGHVAHTHNAITKTLQRYFREENLPKLQLRVPGELAYSPPATPPDESSATPFQINVLLISELDGRGTMVDLTRTLAGMAQKGKIAPSDVSKELIDAEISQGVMGEPDLLIMFGPRVILDGYPPWQVRLTEIFHLPDHSEMVSYSVFLQALYRYSGAQMRFGR